MKQGASNRKVNEQAREVIASILLFEVSDPRLTLVTVTGCEVSYDRSACNVYYTCEPERYADAAAALEGARGRIRSLMARKLSWRVAPGCRGDRGQVPRRGEGASRDGRDGGGRGRGDLAP